MDVPALARELRDVGRLLEAQVKAGLTKEEVLESLCSSWGLRLAALANVSNTGKEELTIAITDGPWSA